MRRRRPRPRVTEYLKSMAYTTRRMFFGSKLGGDWSLLRDMNIRITPKDGWKSFKGSAEEAMLTIERVSEIRNQMDSIFKYKVGAVLRHSSVDTAHISKGSRSDKKDGSWMAEAYDTRLRYVIRERLLQECHGGVQLIYVCRHVSSDGSIYPDLVQLAEHELKPFDMDDQLEMEIKPYEGGK